MHDTDDIGSNPTDNPHLDDVVRRLDRRQVLGGGLAAAAGLFAIGVMGTGTAGAAPAPASAPTLWSESSRGRRPLLGFAPIEPSLEDTIRVPEGYWWEILLPWGTPLFPGAPEWAKDASNTSADQARQVGFNHDGMHFFPFSGRDRDRRGLLVINHEYTDARQLYTEAQGSTITPDAAGKEKVAKALEAHGVTVVEVVQGRDGRWTHVQRSRYNRRVTGTTPMRFSGPVAAEHPMLRAELGTPVQGTLNNCAHGYTPWGTYLACEENFNGYFGTAATSWSATPLEARYGITAAGFGYSWHVADPRFDLARNRNEANRYGWVVEIDPSRPNSVPVKRTALGRFKHEGATVTEWNGRVVVYSGDDENGDYLYKFVGDRPWRQVLARGRSPLDEGTLYVASFSDDGSGSWLPLVHGTGPLTTANGWVDQADVMIRTRMAADALGATRLHRPEWVSVDDRTRDVYVTLTNGSVNNAAAVNSGRTANNYGHIVRFREDRRSASATSFRWEVFLLAGDPAYPEQGGTGVPDGQALFGSPDGIWVDPDRRVWIQTDISNSSQNLVSRGYDRIGNNQLLVADPETREVRRFLTGPRGCEITGITTTPDQRTMFVNVQHPGESTSYWNALNGTPSNANPRTVSNWPDFDPTGRPRSATVVIRRLDGGKVGA